MQREMTNQGCFCILEVVKMEEKSTVDMRSQEKSRRADDTYHYLPRTLQVTNPQLMKLPLPQCP